MSNMIGGYKVNATEVNRQRTIEQRYRATEQWRVKNAYSIYVVVLTIVLLFMFG